MWAAFFLAILGIGITAAAFLKGAYDSAIDSISELGPISVTPDGYISYIYDASGNETAKLVSAGANRITATEAEIPQTLKDAFVSIEDERFYQHNGVDIIGIVRAAKVAVTTGRLSQGASTITQQLIKNSVFTDFMNESTAASIKRKVQEQALAIELEKQSSKEEILTNYLNMVNLGHGALGIKSAAKTYFGKELGELTISECAMIACITQNPTAYDPYYHPSNNNRRRAKTLRKMKELGYISEAEYQDALHDNVYKSLIKENSEDTTVNSYFADAVIDEVIQDLQNEKGYSKEEAQKLVYSGGLKIYSTQDPVVQNICDIVTNDQSNYPAGSEWELNYGLVVQDKNGDTVTYSSKNIRSYMEQLGEETSLVFKSEEEGNQLIEKFKKSLGNVQVLTESITYIPQPQISITIEDQSTGRILAVVGGRGKKNGNRTWNRATDATRQPGSTFKVMIYAAAIDAGGKTLASTQLDEPFYYDNGQQVRNWWGNTYRGYQSVRDAIRESMNVVTVKNLKDIGPDLAYQYLKKLGISTLVDGKEINGMVYTDKQLSLALGGITNGVKNIELNGAYATLANKGIYIEPHLYTKVIDNYGNVLLKKDESGTQVLKKTTAWLLTDAMQDVIDEHGGTAAAVKFSDMPIAGKTGTTSNNIDEWFCGYTPYYTASVWTGYDKNQQMNKTELKYAKNIWKQIMSELCADKEVEEFEKPKEIVRVQFCKKTGLLPSKGCEVRTEYCDINTVPAEYCKGH